MGLYTNINYVSEFTVSYFLILRGRLVVDEDRRSTPNIIDVI